MLAHQGTCRAAQNVVWGPSKSYKNCVKNKVLLDIEKYFIFDEGSCEL